MPDPNFCSDWGLPSSSSIWGPVEQYIQTLPNMQLDVWTRPKADRGYFSWTIERSELDGRYCPTDIAEWVQAHVLPRGPFFQVGPVSRALKEARMTPQGLLLKWAKPAR